MPSAHSFPSPVFRPPHVAGDEKREVALASRAIQWVNKGIKAFCQLCAARFHSLFRKTLKGKNLSLQIFAPFIQNFSSSLSGETPSSESVCLQGGGKSPGSRWEISMIGTHAHKKVQLLMALLLSWSLLLLSTRGTGDEPVKTWLCLAREQAARVHSMQHMDLVPSEPLVVPLWPHRRQKQYLCMLFQV